MTSSRSFRQENKNAGSPGNGEPVFLAVGQLRRPHGVRGELLMEVFTDFPERLIPGVRVYVSPDHQPLHLNSVRHHAKGLLVSFKEYDTPEQVGELRNRLLMVSAEDRPSLPEGEFYHHQIIGLKVFSDTGDYLGIVSEILETGSNDVFVVKNESGEGLLLPATDEVILAIDLELGKISVHLLPGLIPGEE
jgi:16S rRNA processing protein RimM